MKVRTDIHAGLSVNEIVAQGDAALENVVSSVNAGLATLDRWSEDQIAQLRQVIGNLLSGKFPNISF